MFVSPVRSDHSVPVLSRPTIDMAALRAYRLGRLLDQLADQRIDLAVLINPVSLRYVADWREYALFQSHLQTYTLFVTADGALTLFGAYGRDHPGIDHSGPTHGLNSFDGGLDLAPKTERFVADVIDAVGVGARVAVEHVNPEVTLALAAAGFDVIDAEPLVEAARSVKSAEEIVCLRHAVAVAELALATMRETARPGMTENQVFALLHQVNIANDGDWIEGRMLSSGPRTNPWYQQASERVIEAGDLVAVDTDMVGPFGYSADISRTWLVGDRPSRDQRDRYRRAHEEIHHNAALLGPGLSFKELSDKAFRHPEEFVARRYACLAHGIGMTDEYPRIAYRQDWDALGYDGVVVPGMVLTVESFVASDHGGPGVKLEDMYLITDTGAERLSTVGFEAALLQASPEMSREVAP